MIRIYTIALNVQIKYLEMRNFVRIVIVSSHYTDIKINKNRQTPATIQIAGVSFYIIVVLKKYFQINIIREDYIYKDNYSKIVTFITTSVFGRSPAEVSTFWIASTISKPSSTSPNTVYPPSRNGVPPCVV